MKSPWKQLQPLESDRQYLAFASRIPPRSYKLTPQLFKGAGEVRKQLERTPGLVGFSLLARPLRKQYGTLSVWENEEALRTFAASQPHGRYMADLAPEMGDTKFVQWTIRGSEGRPSWREAMQRLA